MFCIIIIVAIEFYGLSAVKKLSYLAIHIHLVMIESEVITDLFIELNDKFVRRCASVDETYHVSFRPA